MNCSGGILNKVKNKIIVSCQALPNEPLYSPFIMGRMAHAVMLGGASGIRANSVADIQEIKKNVDLPIIGIIKNEYQNSDVFITPTLEEIEALVNEGVEIIALDATLRKRPDGSTINQAFLSIKEKFPKQIFMADCSTLDDAINAYEIGFDCVSTTLHGYTAETHGSNLPNLSLIEEMVKNIPVPVIAEGGIWEPQELKEIFALGVHSAVIGTAITRPLEITKRFVSNVHVDK